MYNINKQTKNEKITRSMTLAFETCAAAASVVGNVGRTGALGRDFKIIGGKRRGANTTGCCGLIKRVVDVDVDVCGCWL